MHAQVRSRTSAVRRVGAALSGVLLCAVLTACETAPDESGARSAGGEDGGSQAVDKAVPVRFALGVRDTRAVPIGQPVELTAEGGELTDVRAETADGTALAGRVRDGAWVSTGRLEPGTDYVVRGSARRSDGSTVTRPVRFRTQELTLDEQTFASVAPLAGETVGVGMPVVVTFDLPVADQAAFERHMTVTSTPAQPGTWHWLSDTEAHYRPRTYWQAGTDVSVDIDVNSVPAGNGIYGQESRTVDFQVGDAHVYKVNARTHQMQVFSNGDLLRTLPVTTGKPGFTTRSGTKVIMEMFEERRMNSETVGISADDPEAYDIDDVQWAMRLTHSGEFIHAAPWSVGSQGRANVSHGCTGLSTADAGWLYAMTRRGDVVEYTGTDRWMTLDNGYGDWNATYADYQAGSALS